MFYFYTGVLKFEPWFMGMIKTFNSIAMTGGIIFYHFYLRHVNINLFDII